MRTVLVDDELAALLEREQPLDQAAREALVMDLFRRGKVSTGKACELLGLERMAFVRRAAELASPSISPPREKATIGSSVADSSSLIHLQKIGRLSILAGLFGEIAIPRAVADEIRKTLPELPSWVHVHTLKPSRRRRPRRAGSGGERDHGTARAA